MTEEKQEQPKPQPSVELDDADLEKVQGGARARVSGPGTQTEDDAYVG